jgi:hypothetical protein
VQTYTISQQKLRIIDPTRGGNAAVELPMPAFDMHPLSKNIEPEQFAPLRVPKWAFTQCAFSVVIDHVVSPV